MKEREAFEQTVAFLGSVPLFRCAADMRLTPHHGVLKQAFRLYWFLLLLGSKDRPTATAPKVPQNKKIKALK
eukprot:2496555-Amphidinium_carterae.1